MKKFILVVAVLSACPWSAMAEVLAVEHLVKVRGSYAVFSRSGRWIWACACSSDYLGGAPDDINISPENNDPRQVTAGPLRMEDCPIWDATNDGLPDFNFEARFNSLFDMGIWEIVCYCDEIDGGYCYEDSSHVCGVSCNENYLVGQDEPVVFEVTVYNQLPTADISHLPTPAWNETLTFDADAEDPDHPDGYGLEYYWSITTKPSGAASFDDDNSESPSIAMNDDANIGHWVVKLDLDDQEGERVTITHDFDVPNVPPEASVDGADEIDALETIDVEASDSSDPDGGNVTYSWDIVESPSGSSHPPDNDVGTGSSFPAWETDEDDIGEWRVRVTVTDNEGADADPPGEDSATFDFKVLNLPPRIDFVGATEVDVGDSIDITTSILDDDDGGELSFVWDIIQSPDSSNLGPQSGFSDDATLYLSVSTVSRAGTWIFRLTATDNEGEDADPPGVISEDISVVVDGQPTANITVSAGGASLGGDPPTLSSADFPLTLDAGDSEDPDSPCVGISGRCHSTSDPPVQDISQAIVTYQWALIDVPSELYGIQPLGRVDEVLGINGSSAALTFSNFAALGASGQFTFEVTVWDGEDNEASAIQSVMIINPNTPPTALVSPPIAYMTVNGALTSDITLSGVVSYDLDNVLLDEELVDGLGIDSYSWTLTPPALCNAPAPPSAAAFTLFAAGAVIPPECQGIWHVLLTVGDDDSPQLVGSATTFVVIRNCEASLCIDAPTTVQPAVVEFTDQTDVTILYHLDATIYNHPELSNGAFTEIAIFHEDDTQHPFYVDYDFNVLVNDDGGYNVFNWNGVGVGTGSASPRSGRYHVTVTLLDASFFDSPYTATQTNAISIAVADVTIRNTSDKLVRFQDLDNGSDRVDVDYDVANVGDVDEIDWYVYDAASTLRASDILPGNTSGTIHWNGKSGGITVAPGNYTFVVEAKREGASLGTSEPHAFVVYTLAVVPNDGPAPPQGLPVFANIDDDDWNDVVDSNQAPAPAKENDLVRINLQLEPFDLAGTVVLSADNAAFRVYANPDKTGAITLPRNYDLGAESLPAQVYIEGLTAGAAQLRVQLTSGGVTGPQLPLTLNIVAVEMMLDSNDDHAITAADTPAFWTRIARWDYAYNASFAVHNSADPVNFIEYDPSRFYIRVTDAKANTSVGVAETIQMTIATVNEALAINDNADVAVLTETGPNTGVFVSRSQLLTSNDIPTPDDGFAAHNGSSGTVADNAAGDRTHRADTYGAVRTSYTPPGGSAKMGDVPVCRRGTDMRRRVEVRVHVFLEPFEDIGYDHDGNSGTPDTGAGNGFFDFADSNGNGTHDAGERSEPYVDLSSKAILMRRGNDAGVADGRTPVVSETHVNDQIARADIAWAQACLRIVKLGPTLVQDAPRVNGVDIIADGGVNDILQPNGDGATIFNTATPAPTSDVVDIFFAGFIPEGAAIAFPPFFQGVPHGGMSFAIISPAMDIKARTLAHELGHLLLNAPDQAEMQTIFFPSLTGTPDDSSISTYRRITLGTETTARMERPLGNQSAPGNSFLKNP